MPMFTRPALATLGMVWLKPCRSSVPLLAKVTAELGLKVLSAPPAACRADRSSDDAALLATSPVTLPRNRAEIVPPMTPPTIGPPPDRAASCR